MYLGFLHDPSLDQLTLLAGITAIDHLIGLAYKGLDNVELSLDAFVVYKFYAESLGNHRQCAQRPPLPQVGIVGRLLECAQVTESPCHFIVTALIVAVTLDIGSQNGGNVLGDTRFLGDAKLHGPLD